ncbi:MAG: tetratricopeptide repeat protein, partial [Gelidibacter sp.]|nr:tetratricopeptide repeat protein [Gelidibacter sp.]
MKLFYTYLLYPMLLLPIFCIGQQSKVDSLKSVIALGNQDVEVLKAMNFISFEYVRTDVEKAKFYLWKAKYLGKKLKNDRVLSSTYSQLASINQNQGQIDSTLIYLDNLKGLADKAIGEESDVIKGNYYSTVGLYYKKSGNIKEALPYFIKTYEIAVNRGDLNSASGQAINIGNSYLGLSDFNRALTYYLKALCDFEQTKNKKGQSYCYQNIGECYIELNRYDAALKYINKSMKLKGDMQDKRGVGNAEQSLGRIYMGLENYDTSFKHYSKALTICQELKLSNEEVKIYLNMGKVFSLKNDTDKALFYYEKSKDIAKKMEDNASALTADFEILAIQQNKTKEGISEKNAIENIQSFKETGAISKEAASYKNMATYYTNLKKYDKALEYT